MAIAGFVISARLGPLGDFISLKQEAGCTGIRARSSFSPPASPAITTSPAVRRSLSGFRGEDRELFEFPTAPRHQGSNHPKQDSNKKQKELRTHSETITMPQLFIWARCSLALTAGHVLPWAITIDSNIAGQSQDALSENVPHDLCCSTLNGVCSTPQECNS